MNNIVLPKLVMTNITFIFNKYCSYKMLYNIDVFDYFEFEIYDDPRSNKDIIIEVFSLLSLCYDKDYILDFFHKNVKQI
jgi:hypothetical protein